MGEEWPPDKPRSSTGNFGDSILFEDHVDAKIATALHPHLLDAARESADRAAAAAAAADANGELREACIAVLTAAVAVETATHWVAETRDPALLSAVEDAELPKKWQTVVEAISGARPDLGRGMGQGVTLLARDRNRIAHYPSRGRSFFTPPHPRGGRSSVRVELDAARAALAVATATDAISALGL
jgi:hypothetical protein